MQYRFFLLTILYFFTKPLFSQTLIIACSSNFVPVLEALSKHYKPNNIIIIQGASGKLSTQLRHGLPADIFLSANKAYPTQLYQIHNAKKPFAYAVGELLFLVKGGKPKTDIVPYLMTHSSRIGIANPDLAPYGRQAMQFLVSHNLWISLKSKLVYGENINQTFQHMLSGNLDAAFISKAQWLSYSHLYPAATQSYDTYRVPGPHHRVIQYGAIMSQSKEVDAAKHFVHYLLHDKAAHQVINALGYQTPKS